jgi:hypothetical protein
MGASAKNESTPVRLLRLTALIAVLIGAVGSFGLTLHAGSHNDSIILIVLFSGWVLSPFIALLLANELAKRWSAMTRITLYIVMLLITLGSLASYGGLWSPVGAKPAFVFLAVPLVSWLVMITVIPIAMARSRKD